MIFRRNIDSSS